MKAVHKNVKKAEKKNSLKAFDRLVQGGRRRAADHQRSAAAGPRTRAALRGAGARVRGANAEMLGRYRESLKGDRRHLFDSYRFVEMARKVVGVGSVGTRAWVLLMMGRDGQDPLFLQAKEAEASVLERYVGESEFGNHGERVVEGQWLMQASSDILLGWLPALGIRRRKSETSTSASSGTASARSTSRPCRRRGWRSTAASAAGRWPEPTRGPGDRIAIGAYLGKGDAFDQAIADFSERYADQNELDYGALADAAKSGRIEVETDLD